LTVIFFDTNIAIAPLKRKKPEAASLASIRIDAHPTENPFYKSSSGDTPDELT